MNKNSLSPPLKKVMVFFPVSTPYGVNYHFTEEITRALAALGVECLRIEGKAYGDLKKLKKEIQHASPDCTIAFNHVIPCDKYGNPFTADIKIPHLALLIDPPHYFLHLLHTPSAIIASDDEADVEFYKRQGFDRVFFFPHATPKVQTRPPSSPRSLEVSMISTFIDFDYARAKWKTTFPLQAQKLIETAAEIILSDQTTPYSKAMEEALTNPAISKSFDFKKIDFTHLLILLEAFTKGKHRFDLLLSIKDAPVHLFGGSTSAVQWKDKLPKSASNIIIHDPVSFERVFDVIADTQILLHSCRSITQGGHERIFTGMSYGAVIIAGKTGYLEKSFIEDEEILLFQNFSETNDKINQILSNSTKREEMAKKAFEKAQKEHTWEERAKILIEKLPSLIKKIKENQNGVP